MTRLGLKIFRYIQKREKSSVSKILHAKFDSLNIIDKSVDGRVVTEARELKYFIPCYGPDFIRLKA